MSSVVRVLDSWESYFATLNQQVPIHFVMAARLQGTADDDQWTDALRVVQQRQMLLRSVIRKNAEGRLAFVEDASQPIPLTFLPRASAQDTRRCYAEQLHIPIASEAGSLLRVTVLGGASETDLVIACHHAISDAMGIAYLISDLVHTVNGAPRPSVDARTPLSTDRLWQERYPNLEALKSPPLDGGPPRRYLADVPALPHVEVLSLSQARTSELRSTARAWSVSVHALLCAACFFAGCELNAAWQSSPVRIVTPVDLRSRFGLGDDVCLAITAFGQSYRSSDSQNMRALAETMQRDVAAATTDAALYTATRNLAALMEGDWEMELLPRLVAFSPAYELMVSNLGVLKLETAAGALGLHGLLGPNTLSRFEGQQSVGASTYAGRLSLTYASYNSMPGLLERVADLLDFAGAHS
jgi:hypothetical protein